MTSLEKEEACISSPEKIIVFIESFDKEISASTLAEVIKGDLIANDISVERIDAPYYIPNNYIRQIDESLNNTATVSLCNQCFAPFLWGTDAQHRDEDTKDMFVQLPLNTSMSDNYRIRSNVLNAVIEGRYDRPNVLAFVVPPKKDCASDEGSPSDTVSWRVVNYKNMEHRLELLFGRGNVHRFRSLSIFNMLASARDAINNKLRRDGSADSESVDYRC